ncbi:MAG TPA: hypothetical protein VFQ05_02495 [Candidatus Eisenbacteria bacterium]|nr:hypothetical protein [Candidatus Eisenbacteria bacterium]
MPADFPGAFAALREILSKHGSGMIVQADTPTEYTLVTRAIGPNKKPLWFAGVLSKKSAVTFHLMPLYNNPKLLVTLRPELKARMQGKSCFNFQRPDEKLFAELDRLTAAARDQWKRAGFLEPGVISRERFEEAFQAAGGDVAAMAARRKAVTRKRKAQLGKKRTSAGVRKAKVRG